MDFLNESLFVKKKFTYAVSKENKYRRMVISMTICVKAGFAGEIQGTESL
jgi:hypothetical protein